MLPSQPCNRDESPHPLQLKGFPTSSRIVRSRCARQYNHNKSVAQALALGAPKVLKPVACRLWPESNWGCGRCHFCRTPPKKQNKHKTKSKMDFGLSFGFPCKGYPQQRRRPVGYPLNSIPTGTARAQGLLREQAQTLDIQGPNQVHSCWLPFQAIQKQFPREDRVPHDFREIFFSQTSRVSFGTSRDTNRKSN